MGDVPKYSRSLIVLDVGFPEAVLSEDTRSRLLRGIEEVFQAHIDPAYGGTGPGGAVLNSMFITHFSGTPGMAQAKVQVEKFRREYPLVPPKAAGADDGWSSTREKDTLGDPADYRMRELNGNWDQLGEQE